MGNNKNDILGSLTNILSNVDLNQVISLIGSLRSLKGSSGNSGNSGNSNLGAALGNLDLGKLSEAFANMTSGQPRQNERRPNFFNPNNFNQNNFNSNNSSNNYSGLFDIGSLQSLVSNFTEQLEGLRNFRF